VSPRDPEYLVAPRPHFTAFVRESTLKNSQMARRHSLFSRRSEPSNQRRIVIAFDVSMAAQRGDKGLHIEFVPSVALDQHSRI
jgi:hypothetical protein